jgi:peptidoglycan hydrolase CwlO-like protein
MEAILRNLLLSLLIIGMGISGLAQAENTKKPQTVQEINKKIQANQTEKAKLQAQVDQLKTQLAEREKTLAETDQAIQQVETKNTAPAQ